MMARLVRRMLATMLAAALAVAGGLALFLPWPWALALAAALPPGVHALLIALGMARARAAARRAGLADAPGWWRAWLAETPRSLRTFYLDVPWRGHRPARLPPRAAGAVLLVHGYGCNRGIWRGVDEALARRGWAVDMVDLEPPLGDLDSFGRQVAAAARRLAERYPALPLCMIGHSMGGLAARAALGQDPTLCVAGLVTVGTPHRGTASAAAGPGRCAAQMLPGSPWLAGLNATAADARVPRVLCIASRHDNVVYPPAHALMPGAPARVLDDGVGHLSMLADARVRAWLADALDTAARGDARPPGGSAAAADHDDDDAGQDRGNAGP